MDRRLNGFSRGFLCSTIILPALLCSFHIGSHFLYFNERPSQLQVECGSFKEPGRSIQNPQRIMAQKPADKITKPTSANKVSA